MIPAPSTTHDRLATLRSALYGAISEHTRLKTDIILNEALQVQLKTEIFLLESGLAIGDTVVFENVPPAAEPPTPPRMITGILHGYDAEYNLPLVRVGKHGAGRPTRVWKKDTLKKTNI